MRVSRGLILIRKWCLRHLGAIAEMPSRIAGLGELLVLMGIVATVLVGASHWNTLRRMKRGELPNAYGWPLSITIALAVAVLGPLGCGGCTASLELICSGSLWVPVIQDRPGVFANHCGLSEHLQNTSAHPISSALRHGRTHSQGVLSDDCADKARIKVETEYGYERN